MHAGTGLLMLVAVFVVFYQRGDVLLLGLMILLFVGLALGARQVLPQYVNEAKLLLNIGPMREGERLVWHGLPWRVESINMYTVLRNPELHGRAARAAGPAARPDVAARGRRSVVPELARRRRAAGPGEPVRGAGPEPGQP